MTSVGSSSYVFGGQSSPSPAVSQEELRRIFLAGLCFLYSDGGHSNLDQGGSDLDWSDVDE
jgi:hypothetical protein